MRPRSLHHQFVSNHTLSHTRAPTNSCTQTGKKPLGLLTDKSPFTDPDAAHAAKTVFALGVLLEVSHDSFPYRILV